MVENQSESESSRPAVDSSRLLLENVSESCSDEMVRLYVLLIFNSTLKSDDENDPNSVQIEEMRRNRDRVMLTFKRPFDFATVESRQQRLPELCGLQVNY